MTLIHFISPLTECTTHLVAMAKQLLCLLTALLLAAIAMVVLVYSSYFSKITSLSFNLPQSTPLPFLPPIPPPLPLSPPPSFSLSTLPLSSLLSLSTCLLLSLSPPLFLLSSLLSPFPSSWPSSNPFHPLHATHTQGQSVTNPNAESIDTAAFMAKFNLSKCIEFDTWASMSITLLQLHWLSKLALTLNTSLVRWNLWRGLPVMKVEAAWFQQFNIPLNGLLIPVHLFELRAECKEILA